MAIESILIPHSMGQIFHLLSKDPARALQSKISILK